MKYRELSGLLVFITTTIGVSQGVTCPHPAVPINTLVSVNSREPGSLATYSCDPGYKLFGSPSVTCGADTKWAGAPPHCATNVAWKKPVNQSSTARGGSGEHANDGDLTTVHDGKQCTETLVEASPWWAVDLLQEYEVTVVRITTRGCCGHQPVQDIEIRVGDSTNIQRNRLCAWFPGTIEEGSTKELSCARPMKGRYVFVQMVGVEGSMSLCEVEVYSTQEFSKERCSAKVELSKLGIFNQTCYELQTTEGGTFERGREYCQAQGGDLVHGVSKITHSFLTSELDRIKDKMKTNLIWIGAQKEPQFISRTWRWIDGDIVESPSWGRDQPNNYNGQQNCVVYDGGRDWKWNDVGCELNYLHWICQFQPASCGSPDRHENTTVGSTEMSKGTTVTYQCPVGNKLIGEATRTCQDSGFWSGSAPTCKYIECGTPKEIADGSLVLVDSRTTHAAKVVYECNTNYTIVGEDTSSCDDDGKWSPDPPQCLYSWCSDVEAPAHGQVQLSGRRSGDTANFICDPGYNLQGVKTISCALGGEWSGEAPSCRFIDCGIPEDIRVGEMTLVNGTTFLNSLVRYECGDDYWLDGPSERVCLEDGHWGGIPPECILISCNEPEVPHGGYVTGYSFDVHSEVEYHCELGHFLTGDTIRVCTRDGEWTGDPPTCTYVDCGRVPTLSRGEVFYLNESTFLDSQLRYSCNNNYRISGDHHRVCLKDSLWSGTPPKCEEIRCPEPEHPPLTKNTITGNDRRMSSTIARNRVHVTAEHTYRVGSVVTYRCNRGYVVEGKPMRQCLANGSWNNEPPSCKYVDCGTPESITPGSFRLLSNETSYSSQVAYECIDNWKLEGRIRRFCQENGTWAGETPKCIEVECPVISDGLTEALAVDMGDRKVGSFASYSCEEGRKLIGEPRRECRTHGIWSGTQPRCEWVSCMMPEEIENGRIVRLNETLLYGAVVEYHCLPKFSLDGSFTRTCTGEGLWSGDVPRCSLDTETDYGIFVDNTVDGTTNSARGTSQGTLEEASNTGLYVGLAFGFIAVICVALLFVFLRSRRQQKGKDHDPPAHVKPREEHHNSEVMSYANLSDPTTGNNIYENIVEDGEEYTDMSSPNYSTASVRHTYSNGHQPTYTNGMMESTARLPAHIMRRPRMPPPQPPTVPLEAAPSSVVTINGVTVAANGT